MAQKKPTKAKSPAPKKTEPKKAAVTKAKVATKKPAPKAPSKAKAAPAAKKAPVKPTAKSKAAPAAKAPAKAAAKAPVKAAAKAPAKSKATKAPAPKAEKPKAAPAPKAEKAAVAKPDKAPAPVAPVAKAPTPKPAPKAKAKPANEEDVILKPAPRLPQPVVVEEEDGERSVSLLAGPRNVKPYLAKKGEEYMGQAQLEHFRKILSTWKNDLMKEVDRTVTHMKDEAANPPDPNDRATLESEFSLELRTRDRERKLIRKIDEALARIEDGSYGYCLETGEEIGIKRLEARPVATLSIEAQERRERRERQYGDRDDRYR